MTYFYLFVFVTCVALGTSQTRGWNHGLPVVEMPRLNQAGPPGMPLIVYLLSCCLSASPWELRFPKKDSFIYFVTALSLARIHGLAHTDDQ